MKSSSKVDVLIVGAGPAGLLLATQLAKLSVNVRIIDKQAHPVLRGHADGLQCRTGEVFQALGVKQQFDAETHECAAEVIIYEPHPDSGDLVETSRVVDVDESLLDKPDAYPVKVTLESLPPPKEYANGDASSGLYRSNLFVDESMTNGNAVDADHSGEEVVYCKYVVGCDGARSWVRKALGLHLAGDSANVYWGAFDAIIKTNLPTTRMKNAVHSKENGSVIMVPREGGLTRVYTEMGSLQPGERINRADVTLEKLIAKSKVVMKPFEIDIPYVDWYTCYEIGQRVCDTFSAYNDHVFIAGDAGHTHSPKAGQDHLERQRTAQDLIDFDRWWASLFKTKAKTATQPDASADEMNKAWKQSIRFTSGTGVVYKANLVVDEASDSASPLAKNVVIGSHLVNQQVVGVFNAHTVQLQSRLVGDGRWRLLVFPGNIASPDALAKYQKFGQNLTSKEGPIRMYTPKAEDMDAVIQVLTIFSTHHREVQYMAQSLPEVFVPRTRPYGVQSYDTLFSDEPSHHDGHGRAYEGYGISQETGAVQRASGDEPSEVEANYKHREDGSKMQALAWMGNAKVSVVEAAVPEITQDDDVICKVTGTTICGSDLHLYHSEIMALQKGDILGHEFVCKVDKVGPNVTKLKPGQRVVVSFQIACGHCRYCEKKLSSFCENTNKSSLMQTMYGKRDAGFFGYSHFTGGFPGGQAEYVRVPYGEVNCLPIPDSVSDEEAIYLSDVLPTSYHCVVDTGVTEGDTVAIWGLGPIGLSAARWCQLKGAKRVIAIDGVKARMDYAREKLGIETIDFNEYKNVPKRILELVPGGLDRALDCGTFHEPKTMLHKAQKLLMLETDVPETINEMLLSVRKMGSCGLISYIMTGKFDVKLILTHRFPMEDMAILYDAFDKRVPGLLKAFVETKFSAPPKAGYPQTTRVKDLPGYSA
ncbi:hypothetical protein EMMF5_001995 [Cystobasidiomycetes sp. EMM_F5]